MHPGEENMVEGHQQGQNQRASNQLIQQHGAAPLPRLLRDILVEYAEQRIEGRRSQTHRDAEPVTGVKAEHHHYTHKGYGTEEQLFPTRSVAVYHRLEQCSEETCGRKADNTHRDVRFLDAAVEEHPVYGQQEAAAQYPHELAERRQMQFPSQGQHHRKDGYGKEHAVPDERDFTQGYGPAEKACGSCEQDGKIELQDFPATFVHVR